LRQLIPVHPAVTPQRGDVVSLLQTVGIRAIPSTATLTRDLPDQHERHVRRDVFDPDWYLYEVAILAD
jgi:hypothetical protein